MNVPSGEGTISLCVYGESKFPQHSTRPMTLVVAKPLSSLIQVLLPSLVVGLSALWLLASFIHRQLAKRRSRKYHPLLTHQNTLGETSDDVDDDSTEVDDDEFAEHLSLRHTTSRGTYTETKVLRPRGEVVLVMFEELAILGVFGIFIAGIAIRRGDVWNYAGMPLVSGVVCWVSLGA